MVEPSDKFQSLTTLLYSGAPTAKPETNKTHLRMYTHNLCPFAARARYAFAAKKIITQKVETDLNKKGEWHLADNGGLVPILET